MNRSIYLLLSLVLTLSTSLTGCGMTTLVKPDTNFIPREPIDPTLLAHLKFSYHAFNTYPPSIKKALADSFSALGVHDAIPSDGIMPNRVHVVIYQLSVKHKPDYLEPWTIISMLTLAIIPVYGEDIWPVEIHVIDTDQPVDKQITIIPSEMITSGSMWLPFAFMWSSETIADKEYTTIFTFSPPTLDKIDKLEYLGYRRIFDEVLWNVINNKIKSSQAEAK